MEGLAPLHALIVVMKRAPLLIFCLFALFGCRTDADRDSPPTTTSETIEDSLPTTMSEAVEDLHRRVDQQESAKIRAGAHNFLASDKAIGVELRNHWGFGRGSALQRYFHQRGIANSDWAYAAICEAWEQDLRTGAFDEAAIIERYAAKEAASRADGQRLSEEYDNLTEDEKEELNPFKGG